jgi:hypothetical protein
MIETGVPAEADPARTREVTWLKLFDELAAELAHE